jgi:hypothetical protein
MPWADFTPNQEARMADEKTETVEQEQTTLTDETLNAEPAAEGKGDNPYDWGAR